MLALFKEVSAHRRRSLAYRSRAGESPAQLLQWRSAPSACFPLLHASLLALTAARKQ